AGLARAPLDTGAARALTPASAPTRVPPRRPCPAPADRAPLPPILDLRWRTCRASRRSPPPQVQDRRGRPAIGAGGRRSVREAGRPGGQWKESPQAQEPWALGLSMVKPWAWIRSAKSIVAPVRYGALIRSTTTWKPS